MSFFDTLKNYVTQGENALGIGIPGHGSVYNAVQQHIVQPTEQYFAPTAQLRARDIIRELPGSFLSAGPLGQLPAITNPQNATSYLQTNQAAARLPLSVKLQGILHPEAVNTALQRQGVPDAQLKAAQAYGQAQQNIAGLVAGLTGGIHASGVNFAEPIGQFSNLSDRQPRFEFSDKGMSFKTNPEQFKGQSVKLGGIVSHPELYQHYPEVQDMNIHLTNFSDPALHGQYDPRLNEISVNANLSRDQLKKTIVHEVQHAIQQREGFASGANAFLDNQNYATSPGEIEAQAAARRINLTDAQREAIPMIQPSPLVEPIRGDLGQFQGSRSLPNTMMHNYVSPSPLTPQEAKNIINLTHSPETPMQGSEPLSFPETVKNSLLTPEQTKAAVSGTYTPKSNQQLIQSATSRIAKDPLAAHNFALTNNSDEATATAVQLARMYSAQGNHELAAAVVNAKAPQLMEAGRTIQAASLYDSLSPEGIGQLAARTIAHYNETAARKIPPLTGDQYQSLVTKAQQIADLPEGRAKGIVRQQLFEQISKLIPTSSQSKILALWRTGLLTGPQTVSKIGVSHAAMSALEKVKDIPASMIDSVTSLLIGRRSLKFTTRGLASGARQGVLDALDNLVHGYNAPGSGGFPQDFRNSVNFGNSFFGKVAQGYVDYISRLHGSLYKPFFGAAHLNSLYDQALTEASNKGLHGMEKQNFILDFVKHPSQEALTVAQRDAEMATFQQKTTLGQLGASVQKSGGGLGTIVAPFTRIPGAILTDVVNYSPAGVAKSIIEAIQRGEFTQDSQRQLAQGLGRGVTGTALLAIGTALFRHGMINLDAPPSNTKERALWDLEGRKAHSILINGQWRSVGALGPLGHVLELGGYFQRGLNDNGVQGALTDTFAGAGKTTLEQSYLKGTSALINALEDPSRYGQYAAQNYASSVVPTGVGTIARAFDPYQREINSIADALKNKIPGLRETLLPQRNVLGEPLERSGGPIRNLIDPFQSTVPISTPLTQELQRLQDQGINATPAKISSTQTVGGQKIKLTPPQLDQLEQRAGTQINQQLNALIQTPAYQSLSPDLQQKAIDDTVNHIRTTAKLEIAKTTGQLTPEAQAKAEKTVASLTGSGRLGRPSGRVPRVPGVKTARMRKGSKPKVIRLKTVRTPTGGFRARRISTIRPRRVAIAARPVRIPRSSHLSRVRGLQTNRPVRRRFATTRSLLRRTVRG